MDQKLRISFLFGGASIVLGLVFVFDVVSSVSAGPGHSVSDDLFHSSSVAAICAAVEAALGVMIICFETRAKKAAIIPFAFAILFAGSAAHHYREARVAMPPPAIGEAPDPSAH